MVQRSVFNLIWREWFLYFPTHWKTRRQRSDTGFSESSRWKIFQNPKQISFISLLLSWWELTCCVKESIFSSVSSVGTGFYKSVEKWIKIIASKLLRRGALKKVIRHEKMTCWVFTWKNIHRKKNGVENFTNRVNCAILSECLMWLNVSSCFIRDYIWQHRWI